MNLPDLLSNAVANMNIFVSPKQLHLIMINGSIAIEVIPGNLSTVHHAIVYIDNRKFQ